MTKLEVARKKNETALSLLKRFHKRIQQSNNLVKFKTSQFRKRNKSELKKKRGAIAYAEKRKKIARLIKLGKMEPPSFKN